MSIVARLIHGPQDHHERGGDRSLRDVRPLTVKLSQALRSSASGIVIATAAASAFFFPATVHLLFPGSVLYAAWVLTRRVVLPMHMPVTSGLRDWHDPEPGSRRPKRARGSLLVGYDLDGHEVWLTPEAERQHMTIPGTTGAGKTVTILSLLSNSLARGSGFVLVDGKGQRDVAAKVMGLARRFGVDDNVRVLNFMVASGLKDSSTWNVFASGNADALREVLASQLGEQAPSDTNGVFRERAVALIGTLAPALVWLRDVKGVPLNIEVIRFSIELRWIWKLAMEKVALLRDGETGAVTQLDLDGEIPEEVTWPLRSYLGELPGYDATLPLDKQKDNKPSEQHGYAQFYFTPTFTQLSVSLGHIFKVESGDVDLRDIVLNRRILLVNLPALENSDATLQALGKLVVASLRGMMAQLLGASLEGDYSEANRPGMGPSPFPTVLDEFTYYATSSTDRMLAQGRSLNISFVLGFQEASGLWARLGEKTASLLGNANFTFAMRQQDGGRTREWIEKVAGQTNVTQATSFHGATDGNYREARQAEVRTVCRVDWQDLISLREGEAIFLSEGRRIYGRAFHAEIDETGPKRLNRPLMLPPPDAKALRTRQDRVGRVVATIEGGWLASGREDTGPVLDALVAGFAAAAEGGADAHGCAAAALVAVGKVPASDLPGRPAPPADGTPVLSVSPMLAAASRAAFSGVNDAHPNEPVDVGLRRRLEAVEVRSGMPQADARGIALTILGLRDEALDRVAAIDPPAMSAGAFTGHLDALLALLTAVRDGATDRRAA